MDLCLGQEIYERMGGDRSNTLTFGAIRHEKLLITTILLLKTKAINLSDVSLPFLHFHDDAKRFFKQVTIHTKMTFNSDNISTLGVGLNWANFCQGSSASKKFARKLLKSFLAAIFKPIRCDTRAR